MKIELPARAKRISEAIALAEGANRKLCKTLEGTKADGLIFDGMNPIQAAKLVLGEAVAAAVKGGGQ